MQAVDVQALELGRLNGRAAPAPAGGSRRVRFECPVFLLQPGQCFPQVFQLQLFERRLPGAPEPDALQGKREPFHSASFASSLNSAMVFKKALSSRLACFKKSSRRGRRPDGCVQLRIDAAGVSAQIDQVFGALVRCQRLADLGRRCFLFGRDISAARGGLRTAKHRSPDNGRPRPVRATKRYDRPEWPAPRRRWAR